MRAGTRTRWGYHRLTDSWAGRVVSAASIHPGDLVFDIGAGSGALSFPLERAGARVIAVELHAGRAAALRSKAGPDIRVVEADATDLKLPHRPFRVVANPPYASSAAILRRLTSRGSWLVSADLVLPWYITRRWVGTTTPIWEFSAGLRLPSSAFIPIATCPATILRITRRSRRPQRPLVGGSNRQG